MKRLGWMTALVLLAVAAMAQMPPMGNSHGQMGVVPSSRNDFAVRCGIAEPGLEHSMRFTRQDSGAWEVSAEPRTPGLNGSGIARIWHESKWMVQIHDSSQGMGQMHTAQMCFAPGGRIESMIDRFMDMQGCGCMRFTAMEFDLANGRMLRHEQHFVNANSGQEVAAPPAAKDFPAVFEYRKLEQLPFWGLVKPEKKA